MHIEPGIVEGAKMTLSYATAIGVFGYTAKVALNSIKQDGIIPLGIRSLIAAALVFSFFEVFPHYPIGVSEVHLILGSTLFLMFGAAPAAIGLALGLLTQGLFFAPWDLPQYGMNVTTLLVPLFALSAIAHRYIPEKTAYKDVKYSQCLALSTAYQGAWWPGLPSGRSTARAWVPRIWRRSGRSVSPTCRSFSSSRCWIWPFSLP